MLLSHMDGPISSKIQDTIIDVIGLSINYSVVTWSVYLMVIREIQTSMTKVHQDGLSHLLRDKYD